MRFEIVHVPRRLPWPWWASAVVATWLALGGAVAFVAARTGREAVLCLFKRLTGFPCPACGFGRGLLCVLRGDIVEAWWYNPLLFSALVVFLATLGLRLVAGRKIQIYLTRAERLTAWIVAVVLVLVNWAYVIRYVG